MRAAHLPPLTARHFGLASPLTPYQALAMVSLLDAGAIGRTFATDAAIGMGPGPWSALPALARLELVRRREVAANERPNAWAIRAARHNRTLWWLSPNGAAAAVEIKRVGLAHWLEQGDGLIAVEAA